MSKERLPDSTYIELVRSLFLTLSTTLIMCASFITIGLLVISETSDRLLEILTALGAVAALGRILILIAYRKTAREAALTALRARSLELRFAISYLSFSIIFGAFSARAFVVAAPDARVLIIGLLFGYAAGVAVNLSYRPLISASAILSAVLPTICVTIASPNPLYVWVAVLLAVFLSGAIQSMIARYRFASNGITMSRKFAMLARIDALTGLPNRLALAEQFAAVAGDQTTLAVHCLDLDEFKPVNDLYGHPTGDILLRAVSERLEGLLRRGDFVARIGGDEFVVIQSGIAQQSEADMLARRIVRSLDQPYAIGDHIIRVGTSIGFCLSNGEGDLERLIGFADQALLEAKSNGGGVSRASSRPDPSLPLASIQEEMRSG